MLNIATYAALSAAGFAISEGTDASGNTFPAVRYNLAGDRVVTVDLDLLDEVADPVAFVCGEIRAAMEGRQ